MTLEFDFDRITLDERNNISNTAPKTPVKKLIEPYAPVSPYSDNSPSTPSRSILTPLSPARARLQRRDDAFSDSFGEIGNRIVMSEHKRAEMEGRFKDEPLLKDNPGRFVLFPIKDNDVSIADNYHELLF